MLACLVSGRMELQVTHRFELSDIRRLNALRSQISARVLPADRLQQYAIIVLC